MSLNSSTPDGSLKYTTNSQVSKIRKPFSYLFTSFIEVQHFLNSKGNVVRSVRQNIVVVSLNIETLDFNMQKSYKDNFISSSKVDKLFKTLKIPIKNIQTYSYEMNKKTRLIYNQTKKAYDRIFEGYTVSNQINIKLSNLLTASELIDGALSIGNVLIKSVNFEVDKKKEIEMQSKIILLAAEDSLKRAEITSKALSLNLDDVNSVYVSTYTPQIWRRRSSTSARMIESIMAPDGPTLFSGKSKLNAIVNVSYLVTKKVKV